MSFGHRMKFSMLWFPYNKANKGDTIRWTIGSQMLQYRGEDQSIE